MRAHEFIIERFPTHDELVMRGMPTDTSDNDQEWYGSTQEINRAPAAIGFTCLDAITSILGSNIVTTDENDDAVEGQVIVRNSQPAEHGGHFAPQGRGGEITIPDYTSNGAANIASAVHEAYHAYMNMKATGSLYENEKMVNILSTKWLKKHLRGMELHVALARILRSKISYGHN